MISINNRDPRALYEQVRDAFRRLIVSGAIAADEKLPSVRELAVELTINPNTIQRAYRELESEGYIYSVQGRGSFACPRDEVEREQREKLFKQFDETVSELLFLGVTREQLHERLEETREKQ